MNTYLVKIGGIEAGTVTTQGTVANVERVSVDRYLVTFTDGSTRAMRLGQSLAVIA